MGRKLDLMEEEITGRIIGASIEVHKYLGPGLLENAYQICLARELDLRGLKYVKEKPLPIEYKGVQLESGYRLDFIVENSVIVELKAMEKLEKIHEAQLITYLKLTGCRVGLLINFNHSTLKEGIVRIVL
jgi:GxxExxY protein